MGNVLAASSPPAGPPPPPALVGLPPPPSPPGFTLPPLGGGLGAGAGAGRGSERTPGTAGAAGTADDGACGCLPNPGTFEECHRKCKGEGRGTWRLCAGPRPGETGSAWRPPWASAPTFGINLPERWELTLGSSGGTLHLGLRTMGSNGGSLERNGTGAEKSLGSPRDRPRQPPPAIRRETEAQGHGVSKGLVGWDPQSSSGVLAWSSGLPSPVLAFSVC